jgi:rhodanese-related sulfurtransferase
MRSSLNVVDAKEAASLSNSGALMVDVREPSEYAASRIPASQNVPLSRLDTSELAADDGQVMVFFCAGGTRTNIHAARLAAKAGDTEAYILKGGLRGWSRAGLPVENGDGTVGGTGGGASGGLLARLFGSSST